jgi:large subunit ribosomal protein L4
VAGSTLVVTEGGNENLSLASRNVPDVEVTNSQTLNTYQVLKYKNLLFTRGAMEALDSRLKQEEAPAGE